MNRRPRRAEMTKAEIVDTLNDSVYLTSGHTSPELAQQTADEMQVPLHSSNGKQFPNSELYVRHEDNLRNLDVFIIQSISRRDERSINDSLQEVIFMADAAKRASAREISVVTPYFPYGRQDRKAKNRESIAAAAVCQQLGSVGVNRIVTVDLHSQQTQGNFNGAFDPLTAEDLIKDALKERVALDPDSYVVVSPDGGRAKVAEEYAAFLLIGVEHMPKSRDSKDSSIITRPKTMEGVDGRICLLIDDMIDTAGTLISAAEVLQNSGASRIITAATHGLFSDPATERLQASPIDEIIVTDTVSLFHMQEALGDRLSVLPIAPMLADSLTNIVLGDSLTEYFHGHNNR